MRETFRVAMSRWQWAATEQWRRYARAFRYATGRATVDDGWTFHHDAEEICGCWWLESLSESSVLDNAIEHYGDVPRLPELVRRACARVASKWNSSGDIPGAAENWAFDPIAEYVTPTGPNSTTHET